MNSAFLKKIVWAVDTMESEEFRRNAQFIIGSLTRGTSAEVYPVHVVGYPYANAYQSNDFEEAYADLAAKRLNALSETTGIVQMKPGLVLIDREGSIKKSVELVTDYALGLDADVIVVSTHSRGAIGRLFMGSFAETLLLQSDIPVISVNPKAAVRERISRILMPTAFDERFRPGFQKAVKLAKLLGASLTLFYKEPYFPMLDVSPQLVGFLQEESEKRKVEARLCHQWADRYHVPLEICMDKDPGVVADAIEVYANNNNFDLVILVSQTSEIGEPRVSSLCRKVVRGVECPVWTMKTDDYDQLDMNDAN